MCDISTIILVSYLSLGLTFFNYSGQVTVTYNAHKQTTKHINTTVQFPVNCYSAIQCEHTIKFRYL